jgi:hypothetical protein
MSREPCGAETSKLGPSDSQLRTITGYLKGEAILDAALAKAGIKVDPALVAKGADDLKKRESMR